MNKQIMNIKKIIIIVKKNDKEEGNKNDIKFEENEINNKSKEENTEKINEHS